jgi:hypothetical protein
MPHADPGEHCSLRDIVMEVVKMLEMLSGEIPKPGELHADSWLRSL